MKMRKSLSVQHRNNRASSLCIIGKFHWGFRKGICRKKFLRQFFPLPFHFDSACHTCQRVPHNGSRKKWDKKHFLTFISAAVYSQYFNLKTPASELSLSPTQIECRKNLHIQLNWKLLFVQNYLLWNESFVIVIFHSLVSCAFFCALLFARAHFVTAWSRRCCEVSQVMRSIHEGWKFLNGSCYLRWKLGNDFKWIWFEFYYKVYLNI